MGDIGVVTMLDLNKPIQTRDGRKVEILKTDLKVSTGESILALTVDEDGYEYTHEFYENGSFYENGEYCELDLINISEDPVKEFIQKEILDNWPSEPAKDALRYILDNAPWDER